MSEESEVGQSQSADLGLHNNAEYISTRGTAVALYSSTTTLDDIYAIIAKAMDDKVAKEERSIYIRAYDDISRELQRAKDRAHDAFIPQKLHGAFRKGQCGMNLLGNGSENQGAYFALAMIGMSEVFSEECVKNFVDAAKYDRDLGQIIYDSARAREVLQSYRPTLHNQEAITNIDKAILSLQNMNRIARDRSVDLSKLEEVVQKLQFVDEVRWALGDAGIQAHLDTCSLDDTQSDKVVGDMCRKHVSNMLWWRSGKEDYNFGKKFTTSDATADDLQGLEMVLDNPGPFGLSEVVLDKIKHAYR